MHQFVAHELRELLARRREGVEADLRQPLADLLVLGDLAQFRVQAIDDGLRRARPRQNADQEIASKPLVTYGLQYPSYLRQSFLIVSDREHEAFLELAAGNGAFDEAIFVELRSDLTPTDKRIRRSIASTRFALATPMPNGRLTLRHRITYRA